MEWAQCIMGRMERLDSKRRSAFETIIDVITGFVIYLPVNYFILPIFAYGIIDQNIITMLLISLIYMSIALVRKFSIRRIFERLR